MKRLLDNRFVDYALRGAALVVSDRRWAAPLSAAALGFGIFAGVAIGPGTAGTLATGVQQIVEIPSSSEGDGQSGGGGSAVASTGSSPPLGESGGGGFEEVIPSSTSLAPEGVEPLPAPAPEPKAKPAPPSDGKEDEAAEEETQEMKGTAIHANPAAGSYAMAIEGGELVSVHAPELPEPGTKLSATVRRLANGTFAEQGEVDKEKKRASEVGFRGVVTYTSIDPAAPAYAVSGRGSSLLVHVTPDPAGVAAELPMIGSYVTVTVSFVVSEEPRATPTLLESKREIEPGPPSIYLDLAGIVKGVLPDGHLLFTVDWAEESDSVLTLAVPPEIDSAKLEPGDSYLATATLEPDNSLKLAGIASDEHTTGANDLATAQGDLKR